MQNYFTDTEEFNKYFRKKIKKEFTSNSMPDMTLRNHPSNNYDKYIKLKLHDISLELHNNLPHITYFKEDIHSITSYSNNIAAMYVTEYVENFSGSEVVLVSKNHISPLGEYLCAQHGWFRFQPTHSISISFLTSKMFGSYLGRGECILKNNLKADLNNLYFQKDSQLSRVVKSIESLFGWLHTMKADNKYTLLEVIKKTGNLNIRIMKKNLTAKVSFDFGKDCLVFNALSEDDKPTDFRKEVLFSEIGDVNLEDVFEAFINDYFDKNQLEMLLKPDVSIFVEQIEKLVNAKKENRNSSQNIDKERFGEILKTHYNLEELSGKIDELSFNYESFYFFDSVAVELEGKYIIGDSLSSLGEYVICESKSEINRTLNNRIELVLASKKRKLLEESSKVEKYILTSINK